jgi:hypothetical protein
MPREPATMAATPKCLARSNMSRTRANATNKQPAAWRNIVRRQRPLPTTKDVTQCRT